MPSTRALLFEGPRRPLRLTRFADPILAPESLLLDVSVCGVCRTDVHILDGELASPKLPLVPGHQIVGRVVRRGASASRFCEGERVGVSWLGWTCGVCAYCKSARENLCPNARFTGYTLDGGYAERAVVDERYAFALPETIDDVHAAPLLCAGMIGLRALRVAGDPKRLGIYGFGAAGHLVAQIARSEGREVFAFTRGGDAAAQHLARSLGAAWVGGSTEAPPERLDAAIIFAPAGELVARALRAVAPGGTVVCAGIHMSDVPSFPYALLWGERTLRSVANLTRADGEALFAIASRVRLDVHVEEHPLEEANAVLASLRAGGVNGAAVLRVR
jgi:propanol-preferring alcohol dehydrogenase